MFEFSRDLKRLFAAEAPRDGLTGGDGALLELLDLDLLRAEARSADIAAGRVSAKDPGKRRLEAARVWRELARRTGDAIALRNAAQAAERAADYFKKDGRTRLWAAARCEQAEAALVGVELYGDEGLNTAAEIALREVRKAAPASPAAAIAWGRLVRLESRAAMLGAGYEGVFAAAARFDAPIIALEGHLRSRSVAKTQVAQLRCDRAEFLMGAAARLKDLRFHETAISDLERLSARLDPIYEPLTWSRVQELRGAARAGVGDLTGDVEAISEGVELMVEALDAAGPHHSPLDWARLQHAMGQGMQSLGEAIESDRAFEHAVGCFDRALWATRGHPALSLRVAAAYNRAGALARRAELSAEPGLIDDAVEALKSELTRLAPGLDPVGWAVAQMNLARLYEVRERLPSRRGGERAAASMALSAALDVFADYGLRSLSDEAARGLDRLAGLRAAS